MAVFTDYLVSVLVEGVLIGIVFWAITFAILESTSLWAAVRSSLIAESVGNLPYLAGVGATEPPSLLLALLAAFIFVRLILRVGELTPARAIAGTTMTYFALVAVAACNA